MQRSQGQHKNLQMHKETVSWSAASARMRAARAEGDVVGLSTALGSSTKSELWKQSVSCFAFAQTMGYMPNSVCYNVLLNGCANHSIWMFAALLACGMRKRVVQPDVVSLNTLTSAYSPGGQWTQSLQLLPWTDSFGLASAAGSCATAAQWRSAIVLLGDIWISGLVRHRAGLVEFNAVLNACAEAAAWESCVRLLEDLLRAAHIQPTLVTFGCVAKSFHAQQDDVGANFRPPSWELPLLLLSTCQVLGITGRARARDLSVLLGSCNFALAASSHWQVGVAALEPLGLRWLQSVVSPRKV